MTSPISHRCLTPHPNAVTADAIRILFGRRTVPPPVTGIVGAHDVLATAATVYRAGLRQLAMTIYSPRQVIDEPNPSPAIR